MNDSVSHRWIRGLAWVGALWLICVLPIAYGLSRTQIGWVGAWVSLSTVALALASVTFLVSRRQEVSTTQLIADLEGKPKSVERRSKP